MLTRWDKKVFPNAREITDIYSFRHAATSRTRQHWEDWEGHQSELPRYQEWEWEWHWQEEELHW